MPKIVKKHIPAYLKTLRERINGPLFSNEQSPYIEDYVRLTPEREASIKTEKDLINLLEGLIEDTHNWMEAERFETIRLECIREAALQLGDRSLNRIWNDAALNTDDQEALEQLINRKLRTSRGLIRAKRGTLVTLGWVAVIVVYTICTVITAGLLPIFLWLVLKVNIFQDLYQSTKKSGKPARDFINADFDEEAAEELDGQLAPYVQEINAAKKQLLADRNKKSKKGNASIIPTNIYKTNFLNYFDKRDLQNMSVASRLLKDIIYSNPIKRYYHTPDPVIIKRPGERCMIQWEDGTKLMQRRNQISENTSYFLKHPDETKTHIAIKNGYRIAQAGKVDDNTFWMTYGYNNARIALVDKRTGKTEDILTKEMLIQHRVNEVIRVENNTEIIFLRGAVSYQYNINTKTLSHIHIPLATNFRFMIQRENNPYHFKNENIMWHWKGGRLKLYDNHQNNFVILQKSNCEHFCVSPNENIVAVLYTPENKKSHINIWNLKTIEILNTIEVDWPDDNDSPNEIYFDDNQNICIQNTTTVLTYPYGQQAQECEADRQENFLPFK